MRERVPPLFPAVLGTVAAWREVNGKERYKRALNWNEQLKRRRRARFPRPRAELSSPGSLPLSFGEEFPPHFVKGFEKSQLQPTFSPERLSAPPDWKAEGELASDRTPSADLWEKVGDHESGEGILQGSFLWHVDFFALRWDTGLSYRGERDILPPSSACLLWQQIQPLYLRI